MLGTIFLYKVNTRYQTVHLLYMKCIARYLMVCFLYNVYTKQACNKKTESAFLCHIQPSINSAEHHCPFSTPQKVGQSLLPYLSQCSVANNPLSTPQKAGQSLLPYLSECSVANNPLSITPQKVGQSLLPYLSQCSVAN